MIIKILLVTLSGIAPFFGSWTMSCFCAVSYPDPDTDTTETTRYVEGIGEFSIYSADAVEDTHIDGICIENNCPGPVRKCQTDFHIDATIKFNNATNYRWKIFVIGPPNDFEHYKSGTIGFGTSTKDIVVTPLQGFLVCNNNGGIVTYKVKIAVETSDGGNPPVFSFTDPPVEIGTISAFMHCGDCTGV